MATKAEKEKLIEVLKFTPRTYKIRLWGYGGEYVMGEVDRKVYDYFKARRLDVSEYAWDSDYADKENISEDMQPFYPGSWHDCDGMGHCWGVDRSAGTIQVDDESGNTVYEKQLDDVSGMGVDEENPEASEPEWSCGDEIWIDMKPAGSVVFFGVSSEKGTFFEGDIELKAPFNPGKLSLNYDEIDGNEIITGVTYDGESIDNWGGDTSGKSTEFGFYVAGSNKQDGKGYEKYTSMEDIEYTTTDWFPKKTKPVREGHYEVKTKDGYTYRANWDGNDWFKIWGDNPDKVKVVEWRGVAYDPDEQDLRDELDQIVAPTTQTGWPFGPANVDSFAGIVDEATPVEEKELTAWTVSTYYKKSIEEVEHFTKDGMEIIHTTGWRSGSWTVFTNDGNPPEFEFSGSRIDINSCYSNNIEEVELIETSDGCWDDMEWPDDIDSDERSAIEEKMEEDGYYDALESNDWWSSDTEMWLDGPILIEGDNGYRRIIEADDNGNVTEFKED